jgi:hypothetical protein
MCIFTAALILTKGFMACKNERVCPDVKGKL